MWQSDEYDICDYCGCVSYNGDCCSECYDSMFSDGDFEDLKGKFEKDFIKGTCFTSHKDLFDDKTVAAVNAHRALIAATLRGAWEGYIKGYIKGKDGR